MKLGWKLAASPLNEECESAIGRIAFEQCVSSWREVTLTAFQNENVLVCLIGLPAGCSCDGNTGGSLKMGKTCLTFIFIHL